MRATTGTTTNRRKGAFSIDSSSIPLCEAAAEVLLRAKVAAFVYGLLPEHHVMKSEIVKCVLIVSHNAETNMLAHIQNSKFLHRPYASGGWGYSVFSSGE